jgi:DNA invertase Pin-like site-specific DNA recombinase
MVIAYLRVSTEKQLLENQRNEIDHFARSRGLSIQKWQMEKVSGVKSKEERKLEAILRQLKSDDVLIVSEMSRLSRTMLEIMAILNLCIKKNIVLYSVKEGYAFENNMTSKIMGFAFGMAAEIERNLIAARTKEALAYRKAQGVILGRPKGSGRQTRRLIENEEAIRQMIARGTRKIDIARHHNVSKATLYNFLKKRGSVPA